MQPTITKRAWTVVGGKPGMTSKMKPHQSKQVMEFPVVSAVTKAVVSNMDEPVLLKVNWATHISDTHDSTETESLLTTADMHDHGIRVNGMHPNEAKFGITVEHQFLQFEWDETSATAFFNIFKPTEAELAECQIFELNSPLPPVDCKRRLPQQQ